MKNKIDLNCDMGESFGKYVSQTDAQIMPYISSCNIACGFHSGDPVTITKTIQLALKHDVAIGAHPSYPDLQGFGRRVMNLTNSELEASVLYQVSALKGMAEASGGKLHHVKPHGALYNHACKDENTATAVVEALKKIDSHLMMYAPHVSVLTQLAEKAGLRVCYEAFIDRTYESDLSLRPRRLDDAVLRTEKDILAQLEWLVLKQAVKTHGGREMPIKAQTLCLHSDTPNAEAHVKAIHDFLNAHDVEIASP